MILPAFGIISRDPPDVLAQAAVRLRVDGVRDGGHRDPVVHRLGAPHVHRRHAGRRPPVLHVRDDADRGADGREGVQLARDDVEGLDDVRDADAVRDRLPVPVHDGRLHGPHARDHAGRRPVPGHVLRRRALPLRDGGGQRCSRSSAAPTTGCPKWTGTMYDEKLGKMALLDVVDLLQHHVLPDALPRARRHAAAHSRLRAAVRRLEHGRARSARSASACRSCIFAVRGDQVHPAATARRRRPSRGKAPTRSNGRCRRRRRTTRSRRRRSSSEPEAGREPMQLDRRSMPRSRAARARTSALRRSCSRSIASCSSSASSLAQVHRRHGRPA